MPTMTAAQRAQAAREKFDAYHSACPSRKLLDRIADKWTVLTLTALADSGGTMRYSELSRTLAGVSQKMLTQTLRNLERDGLVIRTVTPSVPVRVDYSTSELGRSLLEVVSPLKMWAETHIPDVERARATYDSTLASGSDRA